MCDQPDPFALYYRLKTPCAKCPFRKEGAIELRPGRLEGIIEDLLENDQNTFQCHNTIATDDSLVDVDDADEAEYRSQAPLVMQGERMCAGAAAYLIKKGRPSVGMRYAMALGIISKDHWGKAEELVIDPKPADSPKIERLQTLDGLKVP